MYETQKPKNIESALVALKAPLDRKYNGINCYYSNLGSNSIFQIDFPCRINTGNDFWIPDENILDPLNGKSSVIMILDYNSNIEKINDIHNGKQIGLINSCAIFQNDNAPKKNWRI